MNGYIRIGIVLSVIWAATVACYAYQEYSSFPLHGNYNSPSEKDLIRSKEFKFIFIAKKTYLEDMSEVELEDYNKELRDAQSQKDKDDVIHYGNHLTYFTAINWEVIFSSIAIPIALAWILVIACISTLSWIIKGFQKNKQPQEK